MLVDVSCSAEKGAGWQWLLVYVLELDGSEFSLSMFYFMSSMCERVTEADRHPVTCARPLWLNFEVHVLLVTETELDGYEKRPVYVLLHVLLVRLRYQSRPTTCSFVLDHYDWTLKFMYYLWLKRSWIGYEKRPVYVLLHVLLVRLSNRSRPTSCYLCSTTMIELWSSCPTCDWNGAGLGTRNALSMFYFMSSLCDWDTRADRQPVPCARPLWLNFEVHVLLVTESELDGSEKRPIYVLLHVLLVRLRYRSRSTTWFLCSTTMIELWSSCPTSDW
jgi:hypothetical protein